MMKNQIGVITLRFDLQGHVEGYQGQTMFPFDISIK